jgi:hypothetical protein
VVEGITVLRQLSAIVTAAAAGAVLLAGGGPASADTPPVATPPGTCSGVIGIDSLAFDPASVLPGATSDATLTATNCTTLSQSVSETWTARFSSDTGTGIPAGCPVIDPLARPVTFAPAEQVATTTGYLVPSGCTADRLTVTVAVDQNGVQLARASADLLIG